VERGAHAARVAARRAEQAAIAAQQAALREEERARGEQERAEKRAAMRAQMVAEQSASAGRMQSTGCQTVVSASHSAPKVFVRPTYSTWHGRATAGAAALLRATAQLQQGWGTAAERPSDARPKMSRIRAAARIKAAWSLRQAPQQGDPGSYREEHAIAASVIQHAWRDRARIRSEHRQVKLRSAMVDYAARWHAAVVVQAAWRSHCDRKIARAIHDRRRRHAFKQNAAKFASMVAADGGKVPMPSPLQAAFAIMATSAKGKRDGEVVKADESARTLGKGELLDQRVGELRERGAVSSLLGIWQHRLLNNRAKQQQQKERERAVWERQQQLMKQHFARQQALAGMLDLPLDDGEREGDQDGSPAQPIMLF